jgi:hypothetical protein
MIKNLAQKSKYSQNMAIFSLRFFFFLGIFFNNKEFVTDYSFLGGCQVLKICPKENSGSN